MESTIRHKLFMTIALILIREAVTVKGDLEYESMDLPPKLNDSRIVGGTNANILEYPYQISLEYYGSHMCGGSILNSTTIATAAHCCDGSSESALSVRVGSSIRESGGQVLKVIRVEMHKLYNPRRTDYDACKLTLDGTLTFGPGIQPIDLCPRRPNNGEPCKVSGWGAISEGGPLSPELQVVTVPIVSQLECLTRYGPTALTDRMICAGYTLTGEKDTCQGDSGGPLACPNGNGDCLAGITSWGYGCARPLFPGVYANINETSIKNFLK